MDPLSFAWILKAFVAGLLMFLAPCTLPLLPAYLGFISGVTEEEIRNADTRKRARFLVFRNSVSFVLGFSVVFMTLGMLASIAGNVIGPVKNILGMVGGIIIIVFGLFMVGILRLPFLAKERRFMVPGWLATGKTCGACLLGGAFALGWTPCIGPILGTVLFFAGSTETLAAGALLLLVFSLGFSVPFILLGLFVERAATVIERVAPYLRAVSIFGGVCLILLGISITFGDTVITRWFFNLFQHIDVSDALMPYL